MTKNSITPTLLISFAVFLSLIFSSSAQNQACQSRTFTNTTENFTQCADLSVLDCSIHWTASSSDSSTVSIAFFCNSISAADPKWIAWGINPRGNTMVGTQALVASVNSAGTVGFRTTSVDSYQTSLAQGSLSFPVTNTRAQLDSGGMVLFATLNLQNMNLNGLSQVWQVGPVSGTTLQSHPTTGANLQSSSTLNLNSGSTTPSGGSPPRLHRKNVHGVLNAVSWGTLLPIGAMFARYLKVFKAADPAWFYLHAACQTSAYAVGVAGWATGIKLGNDSPGTRYNPHRNIGITLFCLGTLQVFALLLRPKKDHKLRLYWNIYHHSVGYTVIILSVINIYKGFDILQPEKKWKRAYTGVIISLGAIAAVLEAFTWVVVLKRKKTGSDKSTHQGANGL